MLLALAMVVTLPNNFTPRPYQARAMEYFDRGGKRAITIWHRRAGKDLVALHQTCKAAHQVRGAYWHFFPTFAQGRRAVWEGYTKTGERIMEQVFPGFMDPDRAGSIVARKNDAQMMLELKCGSIWRLMGTDKTESVGAGPKGVVFSEFALCRPGAWDLVRPMLRESGGWAWFISTPRGNNHAKKLYDAAVASTGWYRDTQTVDDTGLMYESNRGTQLLTAEEMIAEERAEGMAEEMIRQEYRCDFSAASLGSVWGDLLEQLEKRGGVLDFEHEARDIFTSWDLGMSDSTSIWFWKPRGDGVELVDHYSAHGKPMSHYFDEVRQRGYVYAKHFLPHDAKARTLTSGTTILEQAIEEWGSDKVAMTPHVSLLDGIQAGRWLLQKGDTRFHSRTATGLDSLKAYHYAYDEDRKQFSRKPEHDWSSHDADGFRYVAVGRKLAPYFVSAAPPPPPPPIETKLTLDEMWERSSAMRTKRERV